MKTLRPTRGASLLEVLMVISIGTVLIAGAAAHFRTLRQVSDLAASRQEALQNARVAFERIARQIRTARQVAAISADTATITLLDFNDVTHIFALQGTDIRCGNAAATDLLAAGIQSLSFQGYDKDGPLPAEQAASIDAVEVALVAVIPGTTQTVDLATRVRLGRELDFFQVRSSTSYASQYATTLGSGLTNPTYAFGESDGLYAECKDNCGGRYSGFAHGPHYGVVHSIYAGLYMNHKSGSLQIIVRYDNTVLLDRTYSDADLKPVHDNWGWWWINLTSLRAQWLDDDVDHLSIEVRDPGPGNTNVRFDALCIAAYFDPVQTDLFWANSTGSGACPSEFTNPALAFAAPDDQYATGHFEGEDWQSYAFNVPDSRDAIVSLQVRLDGYFSSLFLASYIELRTALATEAKDKGVLHTIDVVDLLPFVGSASKGTILVDITNDRAWTWNDLKTFEVRLHLRDHDIVSLVYQLDAIAWRVVHRAAVERGIRTWSEP